MPCILQTAFPDPPAAPGLLCFWGLRRNGERGAGSQHSATCWASQVGAGQPDSPSQALPPGQSGATPYQPQRLARAGRQEVEKTSGEHMLRLVRKEGVDGCLFAPQGPQAQAAYLAIPTLLKARTSRSCDASNPRAGGPPQTRKCRSVTALHLHLFRSTCARGASHMAGCRAPDSKPGEEPQD
ncbi:uncharacterized protein LOC132528161 isoform X2 [Lagenorhynchus albirostris]|uniref:uncharacterized protein LOC132528161 isoform X2 n=1 Tax=Lagenorhynchus albirostris TaxID=27610 RepID=UPI0028ECB404|nr:uncharacterized protein LOC132528161 isoform X2 [Lagenorhynchus albirostris]